MKCSLCGYQFQGEDGKALCRGCPLAGACHKIKCPNCGYDMPVEPKLVKVFRTWRKRDSGTGRKS